MVVDAPVVTGQGDGAVPDAGVREVAGSLGQGPAAGTLVDLYAQIDGGDLQRAKGASRVVEVICDIGISAGGAGIGGIPGAADATLRCGRHRRKNDGQTAAGHCAHRHAAGR